MDAEMLNRYSAVFSDFEAGEDDLVDKGISALHVSIFDHWLSEAEADSNEILNFKTADTHNRISEYLDGEKILKTIFFTVKRRSYM